MEQSGNIPIFIIPGTLFENIPQNFIENFFRIFWEYLIGEKKPVKSGQICAWSPNFNRIKILTGFDLMPAKIFNRFLFTPIKYLKFF